MGAIIGNRIREERKRLGLSQDAFAKQVGVHRRSQINYESGDREPDTTYLESISRVGVDVGFVLTGESSELSRRALWHILMVIQEFLKLTGHDKELESACRLAAEEIKAFESKGVSATESDNAILALLKKSPILLLDQLEFEELLEKLEFVLETTGQVLTPPSKARAILHLYRALKSSEGRIDLTMVKTAIDSAI
ncbi:MAG: helix-turn-helix transcriptional regulator [Sulfuricella sp.]|nr:helix-turn-helix transcriptional regulator [Sulfuricella sp.]